MYVSITAHVIDIDWTSVCLSVTCWYCVEMAQPIVKLSSLPGSPMILVLRTKLFPGITVGTPTTGLLNASCREKLQFPTNISL